MKNEKFLRLFLLTGALCLSFGSGLSHAKSDEYGQFVTAAKEFGHELVGWSKDKIHEMPTWAKKNPSQALVVGSAATFLVLRKLLVLHAVVFTIGFLNLSHEIKMLRAKKESYEKKEKEYSDLVIDLLKKSQTSLNKKVIKTPGNSTNEKVLPNANKSA